MIRTILLSVALLVSTPGTAHTADPATGLSELLASDRAFSTDAASAVDPLAGLIPMLDAEIVMPVPGKGYAIGREAVIAAFREDPPYKEGKVSWAPVRGGISADGTQGFTYGFLSLTGGDPARRERKYLAYWIKRPEGWRIVTYRQQVRETGEVSREMLPASLPAFSAEPVADPAVIAGQQQSIAAAEKSFSDRAQIVGLKQAFHEFGRPDAMNMYSGADFAYGLDAVVAGFKEEGPSKIHWSTERSFAASSGDLGVSIGYLYPNQPAADGSARPPFPFFTIWRRDGPDKPWRYIAE